MESYSNWHLYTINNEIAVDQVIRYDDLAGSLGVAEITRLHVNGLSELLELPELQVPSVMSGCRPTAHYRAMYDPSTQLRVASVFSKEIQAFGWVF